MNLAEALYWLEHSNYIKAKEISVSARGYLHEPQGVYRTLGTIKVRLSSGDWFPVIDFKDNPWEAEWCDLTPYGIVANLPRLVA